jgi:hypothetical protein
LRPQYLPYNDLSSRSIGKLHNALYEIGVTVNRNASLTQYLRMSDACYRQH